MNIDMEDFIQVDKINLYEFTEKINNIGKEQNKQEFLKNYNDYKTMIENIDDYIKNIDEKTSFENLELNELLKLLNELAPENCNFKSKNLYELVIINNLLSAIENKINSNSDFSIQKIN